RRGHHGYKHQGRNQNGTFGNGRGPLAELGHSLGQSLIGAFRQPDGLAVRFAKGVAEAGVAVWELSREVGALLWREVKHSRAAARASEWLRSRLKRADTSAGDDVQALAPAPAVQAPELPPAPESVGHGTGPDRGETELDHAARVMRGQREVEKAMQAQIA